MVIRSAVCRSVALASLFGPTAQAGEAFGSLDQQIDNPTPIFAELFGRSLAEYQGNLMIGASGDILDTGQARRFGALYEYDAAGTLLRRISNPVPEEEALGFSIDVRGNDMLVGAATMNRAYFLDGDNALAFTSVPAPGAIPANSLFGRQTRFAGDLRVVSAPFDDKGGFLNSGKVYVYDDLTLIATLQPQVLASLLDFGLALTARPGLVAVGHPKFDLPESADVGQVELFDVDPNSPDFGQRVLILRPEIDGTLVSPGGQFGFGVAFDGEHLLVSEGTGGDLWVFHISQTSPPGAQLLARFEDHAAPLPNPGIGAGIDAANGRVLVGSSQEARPDGNGEGRAHYLVYDPADPLFGFSASVNAPVATPNGQNYGESVLLLSDGRFAVGARGFEVDLQPQAGAVFVYNGEPDDLRVELCDLEIDPLASTATATLVVPGLAPIDVPLQATGQMQARLIQSDAALHTVHFTDGQIALDDLNGGPLNLNLQDVQATLTAPGLPARVEADGSFLQRSNGVGFSGMVTATILGIPLTQNLADLSDTVDFTGQVLDATPGMPVLEVPLQIIIPVDLPGPNGSVLINGTLILRKAQPPDALFADSFE